MLLTLTPPAPATDLGYLLHKHPARVQSFDARLRPGARLLPGGDRRALHRRAAARRRPGRAGARRGGRRRGLALDAVRQRPAVRRVVVPERGDRPGVRHARWPARARTGPSWPTRRSRWRRGSPSLPCRGGEALPAPPVRAARLRGRRRAAPARRALPRVGREPLLHRHAAASAACATCWRTCTCWSRCSTTRSTTGSATTRWRSCCATARAGWRRTPSAS